MKFYIPVFKNPVYTSTCEILSSRGGGCTGYCIIECDPCNLVDMCWKLEETASPIVSVEE